jgi:CheY-like chemotaxis protein
MPRLLLVDDNPSIHKIAETLLAASDVQLISCGSGAEAMALVHQGDQFDVALLDTSMMGMDGWALLQELRANEATARMPVAMMAGVLDIIDPEKLRLAPIQGFLKKPVELRDLGERVRRLMETPVPAPVPAPEPEPEPEIAAAFLTRPSLRIPEELKLAAADDDLLLLGPEDLAEEPAEAPHALDAQEIDEIPQTLQEPAADEPLELEELDLDGLQGLTFPTSALPAMDEPAAPAEAAITVPDVDVPEFLLADTLPEAPLDPGQGFADQLPDLGPALEPATAPGQANLLELGEPIDWSDDSDALVGMALSGQEPSAFPPNAEPSALAETPLAPMPEVITLSDILDPPAATPIAPPSATPVAFEPVVDHAWLPEFAEAPELPATVEEAPAAEAVPDPLAALLADPVLMDRLAKALVARLGEQVLREIAWEVMPELAQRLQQQEAP